MRSEEIKHQIISRFDALRPYRHTMGHPPSCPTSRPPEEIVAILAYKGAHRITIAIQVDGCPYASNGDITLPTFNTHTGRRLEAQLTHLTQHRLTYHHAN